MRSLEQRQKHVEASLWTPDAPPARRWVAGGHRFVDESHQMDAVRHLVRRAKRKNTTNAAGWTKVGLVLWLIPDPTNRFDPNAIKVCATADGKYQVGYIPAARAARWAELIESPISIKGSIVGKRGKWGVKLDVGDLKAHSLRRR